MAGNLLGRAPMHLIRFVASATLLTTLGSLAIACSSNDGKTDSVDGACAQYAAAVSAYTTRCGGIVRGSAEERLKLACSSGLSLPGTAITAQALNTCANAVRNLSCDTDFEDISECQLPAGRLTNGAACVADEQCASQWCERHVGPCGTCASTVPIGEKCSAFRRCVAGATCVDDTCVAVVRNPVGGRCATTDGETCQSNLYCDVSTRTCKAYVPVGGACSTANRCESGLTCDATSSKCVAPTLANEGQSCSSVIRCATGLACDPTTTKCVKIAFVEPGGDCSGTFSVCDQGSCTEGTKKCPTVIPDGSPCDPSNDGQVCARYASCVNGKCALPAQVVCK